MTPWPIDPGQAVWIGLTSLSLEFFILGFALREDRTFRFLGLALLLLCLMVGCDIWVVFPGVEEGWGRKAFLDAFQLLFQALACALVGLLLMFVRHLTSAPGPGAVSAHLGILSGFTLLSVVDAFASADLFIGLRGGDWHASPTYEYFFTPYLIGTMSWITWIAVARRRTIGKSSVRILDRLGLGFAFLLICGTLDFAALHSGELLPSASFTLIGMLGFAAMCVFLLTDRLAGLYTERRRYLIEAARVHGELDADGPLREIGRSAALVSNAIRDNVARLRVKVESLRGNPSGSHGAELDRIERARRRLERMATGILEFSRSGQSGGKTSEDPGSLIRESASDLHPSFAGKVIVRSHKSAERVMVDRSRVGRALRELLQNAFEAGAASLEVRILRGLDRCVIVIEDDGPGFPGVLADIVKPFFTTRKEEGAIGLGASIAAGLLRGQDGSLRHYRRSGGGLLVTVVLPLGVLSPIPTTSPSCALASDDPARCEDFLAACENLGVRPSLVSAEAAARVPADAMLVDGGREPITEEVLLHHLTPQG